MYLYARESESVLKQQRDRATEFTKQLALLLDRKRSHARAMCLTIDFMRRL